MKARLQVALLFGGRSGEHEVSLVSAASVAAGLSARHDVACVLIDKEGRWLLQEAGTPRPSGGEAVFLAPVPGDGGRLRRLADARELARPDVFFPVLHGTHGEDGRTDAFALTIDIAPTLLELARAPLPESLDGRSLVPFLRGTPPSGWRTDALITNFGSGTSYTLRTVDWMYNHQDTEEFELYDMRADPYQLRNLYRTADPALLDSLPRRTATLAACRGASCR